MVNRIEAEAEQTLYGGLPTYDHVLFLVVNLEYFFRIGHFYAKKHMESALRAYCMSLSKNESPVLPIEDTAAYQKFISVRLFLFFYPC